MPHAARGKERAESRARPVPGARRLVVSASWSAVLSCICCAGCAQPIRELWPPEPGESTRTILVSVDRWHSVIALPADLDDPGRGDVQPASGSELWEEWGYAEEGYYLEGDTGSSGTLRALFLPSDAVVQVTLTPTTWSERTPQPPARSWIFHLSEKGYGRLIEFLEEERASEDVLSRAWGSSWYPANESYHAFHHCYHWTARALRSAGLPIWSAYALLKSCFEAQLDRALEIQADARTAEAERRVESAPATSGPKRNSPSDTLEEACYSSRSDGARR